MHKTHQIKNTKRKAYKGTGGARRKQFCDEYRRILPQIYSNLRNACTKTLEEGEQISCRKGCCYCCYQHVWVTLGEGIVIVDYLYSHDGVLNSFLDEYPQWREFVGNISRELDAAYNSAIQDHDPDAILRQADNPLILSYYDIQVHCPFLVNSSCSIYEVRPWNCAGIYSTSPCEWCSKGSPKQPRIRGLFPSESDMIKFFSLPDATPSLWLHRSTLPMMVYELLVGGLPAFLGKWGINTAFI